MSDKTFDPHKPFTTRNGQRRKLVAVLEKATPVGATIIVQAPDGALCGHLADGQVPPRHELPDASDLINIPERVEVEAWAVLYKDGGRSIHWASVDAHQLASNCCGIVIRLTGSYER